MYERLIQEYRIWLADLLDVLHAICEDVVPAGRVREDMYLESKILYRNAKSQRKEELERSLFRYALRGKELLYPVKVAVETVEEHDIIRLRRTYAGAILSSLQLLVNYAYLADTCKPEDCDGEAVFAELGQLFEVDKHDEVKRIRSGVQVMSRMQAGESTGKIRVFRSQDDQTKAWNSPAAG